MQTLQAFIKRHAVPAFYVLVFAISWGVFLLIIGGPGAIPAGEEQIDRLLPLVMLAWFAGPSVAGVLLTALVYGRAGLRELLSRLLRWRVGARWYAVALLTAPLVYLAVLLPLSRVSSEFVPGLFATSDKAALLLFGFTSGLIGGGLLEELGWTGFALPALRSRHGVLASALIVGVLWGAVHFTVIFWLSAGTIGGLPVIPFLTVRGLDLLVGGLVAFRVLMAWVYERTQESLLVAILMHASLSASMLILAPLGISGLPFLTYCLVWSAAMWVVVGAVAMAAATVRGKPIPARPGIP